MRNRGARAPWLVLSFAIAAALAGELTRAQQTCTVSISMRTPESRSYDRAGGPGTARLTASTPSCAWTIISDAPWLTVTGPTTGTGSAFVPFEVAPLPPGPIRFRSGALYVGAQSDTVFQNTNSMLSAVESPTQPIVVSPFTIAGWAALNGAGLGSEVDAVIASVHDGTSSTFLGTATIGLPRDHVADRYGPAYRDSGWSLNVPPLPPGNYTFNVQAHQTNAFWWLVGNFPVTVVAPALSLNVSQVRASVVQQAGAVVAATPPQPVIVSGIGASPWTASTSQPWITLSPVSGVGDGRFTVSVDPTKVSLPPSGILGGTIRVNAAGVPGATTDLPVFLSVYQRGTTAAPFGSFDTPAEGATGLSGAIAFTGWALDDVGVSRVLLFRDPVVGEPQTSLVYIGDAPRVEGARADVAAAHPDRPSATSAGWGYMLLSNVLPNQGNGTFKFYAYALDAEGRQSVLGTRTVTIDNAAAAVPFGTIDLPAQGEVVSGVYTTLGWILTPQPAAIRPDGLLVRVLVDGQFVGNPIMGQPRADVAALFPGLYNTHISGGQFRLDTRLLKNGIHTIAWTVSDSLGRAQGIGSRYFIVNNP